MNRRKRNGLLAAVGAVVVLILVAVFLIGRGDKEAKPAASEQPTPSASPTASANTGPQLVKITPERESVGRYDKLEWTVELKADYVNPYDPAQVDLGAVLTAPSGKEWNINGYYDGTAWKLRFSADETGKWNYQFRLKDKTGESKGDALTFEVTEGSSNGWIQPSQKNKHALEYRNGTSFYGVGVAYPWGVDEWGLDRIKAGGGNLVTYWNGNYDNSGSGGGNEQLESLASGLSSYDMRKAARIDELLGLFEARDLNMSFVIWPHDSLADKLGGGWATTWTKNAYSALGEASKFYSSEEMWNYQEKLYRYIIARYGHSRSIGIWDLICEVNGTDGWVLGDPAKANEWLTRIHTYFKEHDPYGHPTMGSMAGGAEDFWDHGYQTLDLADRENYYSLDYRSYAEDISSRWKYGKPIMIGETGNVTDETAYHNVLWVTWANGLASTPIWWDYSKIDDAMFAQMKVFSDFIKPIGFTETREPLTAEADIVKVPLPAELSMEDGKDYADWGIPDWADANKDKDGIRTTVQPVANAEKPTVQANLRFATGQYSQGVIDQVTTVQDWSGYDELVFDVHVDTAAQKGLIARPVLFPGGEWNEADDPGDVPLAAGKWTTVRVKLDGGKWKNRELTRADLARMERWGLKVYATSTPNEADPVTIQIRNPRLVAKKAPTIEKKTAEAWMMKGASLSYGWMVTDLGKLGGRSVTFSGMQDGSYAVDWSDPWTGQKLTTTEAMATGGKLTLIAPAAEKADLVFTLHP
ncbi:DUF5060 domain-containing protein [Gorillibacterium timonense]|uniref:DUF5060 domain-containing protein n=1 Tax=Gorillibacterium timonense TaxID=1689269 RepID=UPI00071C483B|nr:DUF5060 domain-containing protein [Gorillibacterium timonense]